MMHEALLHYLWQQRLFPLAPLTTTAGEPLEIISVGIPNPNAGADFFNAKVSIGGVVWAGDVEIHLASTDWKAHRHHTNPAYNNVILHVVATFNTDIYDSNGRKIPQFILPVPPAIRQRYDDLVCSPYTIPCEQHITAVSSLTKTTFATALVVERMMRKAADIQTLLAANGNDWSSAFYTIIARSFGFGKNADAMQLLAQSLPLNYIAKHRDNLLQVEALLFGQASLLPFMPSDEYTAQLMSEYNFLRAKFSLTPISPSIWKMARLRPQNFPQLRVAQFAALLHSSSHLLSQIVEKPQLEMLRTLFDVEVSPYWRTHYTFGSPSRATRKRLSSRSIDGIIINTVVPFLFVYGKQHNDENYTQQALALLEQIPPENNAIVAHYQTLGFRIDNAADSQAILQLHTNYCTKKDCLRCRIGNELMRRP